jgi:hypothetical protein
MAYFINIDGIRSELKKVKALIHISKKSHHIAMMAFLNLLKIAYTAAPTFTLTSLLHKPMRVS